MKETFTKLTKKGRENIDKLCDSTLSELTPDNTIGDFITELMTAMAKEVIGNEALNMTIGELEANPEKAMMLLDKLFASDWYDIYCKVTKPEVLMD